MDEILVFPCNIKTNEVPSTIISLVSVGTLNIFNKKSLCSENEDFNFLKTHFSGIIFTFVDDFTLDSDNTQRKLKFWGMLAFVGLHWPFWPLRPLMIFKAKNGQWE